MGDQHAPQIAKSDDPLRDDALYLTFGWPLWLFSEVRHCLEAAGRTEQTLPQLNAFARTLLELDGIAEHDIQPMGLDKSRRIFAYAVVLGHIRPIREDRVIFDEACFRQHGLEADSMASARQRFAQLGLNRRLKRQLDELEVGPGFVAMVHSKLTERRAELERAPDALRSEMSEAVRLVEEDVQRFVPR